jgi:hypothetical protein
MGMVVTRFDVYLVALDPTEGYEIKIGEDRSKHR